MIPALIDKQDSFEIVSAKVAEILVIEVASQMALATAAGKDPQDWKMRVYAERSAPWEQFKADVEDKSPVINIWYESTNFKGGASDTVFQQAGDGTINIDCYGYGVSSDDPGGGHNPGDRGSSFAAHKALRLVRNIAMAAEYMYLGLQGLVGKRWPSSASIFQPQFNERAVQNVMGARFALVVSFNEFSPQVDEGNLLEAVSVNVHRAEDGEIVLNADYEYI